MARTPGHAHETRPGDHRTTHRRGTPDHDPAARSTRPPRTPDCRTTRRAWTTGPRPRRNTRTPPTRPLWLTRLSGLRIAAQPLPPAHGITRPGDRITRTRRGITCTPPHHPPCRRVLHQAAGQRISRARPGANHVHSFRRSNARLSPACSAALALANHPHHARRTHARLSPRTQPSSSSRITCARPRRTRWIVATHPLALRPGQPHAAPSRPRTACAAAGESSTRLGRLGS
ncbi:hypothetical protein EV643_111200 [Kribbella sp. VKM Ac-2527]|uniref:Uncharacterized protein n=1 Tax=Kribbella caucasensis TaxID=2512215 RepID=A0A4V3C9N2_9ACTN|nr:hypothetical protein EV643_111200 [Kribbella sp. VKM Ac-2527]